jgi:hypothetical protein
MSELPVTTIVRQWLGTIDAERFFNVTVRGLAPGPVGTAIWRMTRNTAGYGFALTLAHHRTLK